MGYLFRSISALVVVLVLLSSPQPVEAGFFDKIGDAFDKLGDDIKDTFKDVTDFAGVKIDDLKKLSGDIIAQADNLASMSKDQFQAIQSKMHEMSDAHFKEFLSKVDKDVFKESLEKMKNDAWTKFQNHEIVKELKDNKVFGEIKDWTKENLEEAKAFVEGFEPADFREAIKALEKETNLGEIKDWTKEKFVEAKDYLKGLRKEDFEKIGDDLIASAEVAKELVADQIKEASVRVGEFTKSEDFKKFFKEVVPDELKAALKGIGTEVAEQGKWAKSRMQLFYERMEEDDMFGKFADWNVDTFSLLGDMLGPLVLEGKIDQINKDTFKALGGQIVDGVVLSKDFSFLVFTEKVNALGHLATQLSEVVGGDVEKVTKEVVSQMGPAIIKYEEISRIPGQVLLESIPDIVEDGFGWASVKSASQKFADRVKDTDVYGDVKEWTATKFEGLKEALPAVITEADIKSIDTPEEVIAAFEKVSVQLKQKAYDSAQLKALGDKLKDNKALGAVSAWTKEKVEKAGSLLAGLSTADLKVLKEEAVAAISAKASAVLSEEQLNALGDKLKELTAEAKAQINGKTFKELAVGAKKALVDCVEADKCPFVVDFNFAHDDAQDLKAFFDKHVETATSRRLLAETATVGDLTTRVIIEDPVATAESPAEADTTIRITVGDQAAADKLVADVNADANKPAKLTSEVTDPTAEPPVPEGSSATAAHACVSVVVVAAATIF